MIPLYDITGSRVDSRIIPDRAGETHECSEAHRKRRGKLPDEKIAVVTGGNKGIGFGICRSLAKQGIRTILTARDVSKGEIAKEQLKREELEIMFHPLDVTDENSIDSLAGFLAKEFGKLDILINNAAIRKDAGMMGLDVPIEIFREMMDTNLYGPLMMCQALAPLLKKSSAGRIVNVSSGMGSLTSMGGGSPAYRITKTALNAMTKVLASEFRGNRSSG